MLYTACDDGLVRAFLVKKNAFRPLKSFVKSSSMGRALALCVEHAEKQFESSPLAVYTGHSNGTISIWNPKSGERRLCLAVAGAAKS